MNDTAEIVNKFHDFFINIGPNLISNVSRVSHETHYKYLIRNILTSFNFPSLMKIPLLKLQGAVSIRKTVLPGMAIPMLKIRRPNGRLIFNMESAIRR